MFIEIKSPILLLFTFILQAGFIFVGVLRITSHGFVAVVCDARLVRINECPAGEDFRPRRATPILTYLRHIAEPPLSSNILLA